MDRTGVVLGRGKGVWSELARLQDMTRIDVVIVTNQVGRDYDGRVDHWVSFHPDLFSYWEQQRAGNGLPALNAVKWSGIYKGIHIGAGHVGLQYVWCEGGSTGLLASLVAVDGIGLKRVVLCGVPMTNTERYDTDAPWREAKVYVKSWQNYFDKLNGRVRSMSGWTQELLGSVDQSWLEG